MFRVVLDANVLVSAATSHANLCGVLLIRWQAGDFEPVSSDELLGEVADVLARPKFARRLSAERAAEFVSYLRRSMPHFPDPEHPASISRDPDDDYIFALAVQSGASVIVTGDRDVLEVERSPVPVVSPRQFLEGLP